MAIANVLLGYGAGPKETVLMASDGSSNSRFGFAVSMSKDGNYLAVGAATATPGATYVFNRSGSTWSQMQKINTKGGYVAMNSDGTRMVVSSYYHYDNEARLYTRSGSTWSLTGTVPYSGPVAISGDGQHFAVAHGVYVEFYSVSGSTITARGQVNSYPYVGGAGIMSMDMDYTGSVCIAGCPETSGTYPHQGYASVMRRTGTSWAVLNIISRPPAAVNYVRQGHSVATNADGMVFMLGAPTGDLEPGVGFALRVEVSTNGGYTQGSKYDSGMSRCGRGVALDSVGTRIAYSGQDAVCCLGNSLPTLLVKKATGEGFGHAISMSGDGTILAVAAPEYNGNQGRVYVYG